MMSQLMWPPLREVGNNEQALLLRSARLQALSHMVILHFWSICSCRICLHISISL
ncbi:hypothetical protein GLYMA_12G114350v4 [Glycine max]|nr:hypothetical protein GLYMA_12G114350v4 [Glycine max]KAH1142702.1 hypothetical protein GYH30_033419 [Glycine max]